MLTLQAIRKHLTGNLGLLVLFIVIECLVLFTWKAFYNERVHAATDAFDDMVTDLTVLLKNSLHQKAQVLAGLKGLYDASNQVDENEFIAYVQGQSLGVSQQGVSGFHYATFDKSAIVTNKKLIPRNNVAREKDEFEVAWSHVLALPTVVDAAEYAVKNNAIAVTELLKEPYFKSETLMLIAPIYKKGAPIVSHNGSWDYVEGVVFISYRMSELMSRLVVNITQSADMHVYSGSVIDENSLLLDTRPDEASEKQSLYSRVNRFSLYGKTFTVLVYSKDEFEIAYANNFSLIVVVLGTALNIFLILLLKLFLSRAEVAHGIALGMTKDLQHKHNELTMSESRFRLALELSTMGAWVWKLDSNEIDWDASIYPVFGIDINTPLATYEDFLALIHSDDREKVFNQIASAIENKTPFDSEYRIPSKSGGFRYIASRAQIIYNEESQTFVMAGTCWDVTERKRLDKLKTEFVSTVSHELRTPLTAISGALGLAVGGALGNLDDKAKSILDIANKNAQRLKLLINDLLDMDKLLAGKLEFHCEPCFVISMLERSVAENQAYADQFNVQIMIVKFDHSLKINVEEPRFLQVMANFLSNAAKFSPENGKIIVSVSLHKEWVRIAVSDEGEGIPEAAQQHIFEKFYQADSSDTRKKGGTGLGLAITKEIVERMHGRVGFMSDVGVGSTFYTEFQMVQ